MVTRARQWWPGIGGESVGRRKIAAWVVALGVLEADKRKAPITYAIGAARVRAWEAPLS